jgi:predicted N-formylglutamate amidohydrolase
MTDSRPLVVIVTCEHGGNRIPAQFRRWFVGADALLASHRGYDPGALAMGRALAAVAGTPLIATTISRLLVEVNRSPHNPRVFSAPMRAAPPEVRRAAFERYYVPHHAAVAGAVQRALDTGARVLHIGSHSFTPTLDGIVRNTDIGLLYDPRRALESAFCDAWLAALEARPVGRVRRNYPYVGTSDGLPTLLRRRHAPADYLGIELEVNQRHPLGDGAAWRRMQRDVAAALAATLRDMPGWRESAPRLSRRSVAPGNARRSPAAPPPDGSRAATRAGR